MRPGPDRGRPVEPHAKTIVGNPFVALTSAIKRDIDARLATLLDERLAEAKAWGPEVVDMIAATRDLCLRGGKRLRPALVAAGYRAASGDAPLDPALEAGAALELLQTYFLIHDDWMDGDTLRRGGPAVHTQLAAQFHSRRLGDAAGILAGDFAVALATSALARVDVPAARMPRVLACFAEMQIHAVAGQQLDVVARDAEPEAVYALKTGSYTVRGPLRLGALLAGAGDRVLGPLERYAVPIGVAFQLRDDLLGAFGDPKVTGKPFGSDLRAGKRTALLHAALKRARGRDHRLLKAAAGNSRASAAQMREATLVLERCGAREAIERRITELTTTALAALRGQKLTAQGVELLEGAARALTLRQS